ncbi:MAG: fasciclin domain-containing protein [Desulfobacteraceae bacterium]|nr:fasciclin domain-containing protein [Desulfobacteraceae bacterium]
MKHLFSLTVILALIVIPSTLIAGGYSKKAATLDIVDTAVSAGDFNTLITALKAAELEGVLRGEGPFTVFAPTDEAFGKLPEGTLADLLLPENKSKLQSILTYHVVPGNYPASEVVGMSNAKTANGKSFTINQSDGAVMVDNATVVKTDIMATNGVIHVIDSVILPE